MQRDMYKKSVLMHWTVAQLGRALNQRFERVEADRAKDQMYAVT